jgi:hypothetical protein
MNKLFDHQNLFIFLFLQNRVLCFKASLDFFFSSFSL